MKPRAPRLLFGRRRSDRVVRISQADSSLSPSVPATTTIINPPDTMPARDMTQGEKDRFDLLFPPMNVDLQPRVTAEATPAYNCIAWTVGITNSWINPLQSLARWDAFYNIFHYERADAGQIAIWRTDAGYTHGCVANAAEGFGWESKCGQSLRILHHLGDLVSPIYGQVIAYYRQAPAAATISAARPASLPAVNEDLKAVKLHDAAKAVPAPVREEFHALFHAWKKTWFADAMAFSSDTLDRGNTHSYRKLLAMGPEILPLVVKELDNPENFIAVQLYDDLVTEPAQRSSLAAMPYDPRTGEQGLARNIVAHYIGQR